MPFHQQRKNPIPSGIWNREGPTFDPVCNESPECIAFYSGAHPGGYGTCKCSGWSNNGPLLPNLEVVDRVVVPAGTKPGKYVLQWRWVRGLSSSFFSYCCSRLVGLEP